MSQNRAGVSARQAPPHLKPWKPGQSGNPGGRPAIAPIIDRYAGKGSAKLVEALCVIGLGDAKQRREFFGESFRVSAKDRITALSDLTDRRFGKAASAPEDAAQGGGPTFQINVLVPRP